MIFRLLNIAARVLTGGAFLYAGITKIQAPLQFAATLEAYQLLPPALVVWVADTLPWFEVILGAALLVGWKARYIAWVAAVLLAGFIVAMAITYARGIEADCGCFGIGEKISPLTLLRDSLFMVPALYLILQRGIESAFKAAPKTAAGTGR
jgi:uncharacterized membrane protein YphA (DoxX/SURF4 family)